MFPSLGVYCVLELVSFCGILGVMVVALPDFCLIILLVRDLLPFCLHKEGGKGLISRDQTARRGQDRTLTLPVPVDLQDGLLFSSPPHPS